MQICSRRNRRLFYRLYGLNIDKFIKEIEETLNIKMAKEGENFININKYFIIDIYVGYRSSITLHFQEMFGSNEKFYKDKGVI